MPNPIKIGVTVVAIVTVLPLVVIIMLFVGTPQLTPSPSAGREIQLANHGTLIIDGKERGR